MSRYILKPTTSEKKESGRIVRVKRLHSKDRQKSSNSATLEDDLSTCEVLLHPSYSPVIPASPK